MKKHQKNTFNAVGVRKHADGHGFTVQASKAYGILAGVSLLAGIGIVSIVRPLSASVWNRAKPAGEAAMDKLRSKFGKAREEKPN